MNLTLSLVLAMGGGVVVLLLLSYFLLGVRYVRNDRIGIVERRVSSKGSIAGGFIALSGEAGFQPGVLRGGLHFRVPVVVRGPTAPLVPIPQGRIGYVFARDGRPLAADQTLGSEVECAEFQDVAAFLRAGGQRGPQRRVLREGTYAINLAEFVVITADRIYFLPLDRNDGALFQRMQELVAKRLGFEPV